MQQRDAANVPQVKTFRPDGNSPSIWHLTHIRLLCYRYLSVCIYLYALNIAQAHSPVKE